jgi:hypothetical protein
LKSQVPELAVMVIGVRGDVPAPFAIGELVDHLVNERLEKVRARELKVRRPEFVRPGGPAVPSVRLPGPPAPAKEREGADRLQSGPEHLPGEDSVDAMELVPDLVDFRSGHAREGVYQMPPHPGS